MNTILKNAREAKGFKTREVAQILGIDQALISKFESGNRKPTRDQVIKLASLLEIDFELIMIAWLKEKILFEVDQDEFALQALAAATEELEFKCLPSNPKISIKLQKLLNEIDILKTSVGSFYNADNYPTTQVLELEYTFESNRLEGNTMTFHETDLVINEGVTIAGKSMREHLETINHQEAIDYINDLAQKSTSVNARDLLSIYTIISRGIQPLNAIKDRKNSKGEEESSKLLSQANLQAQETDELLIWYETKKNKLHPIVLAAEAHERIFTNQTFKDGNGKTSRLIMNLILLHNGYVIANIKGDDYSKKEYCQSLEKAQIQKLKEDFILLIARAQKESLERYVIK